MESLDLEAQRLLEASMAKSSHATYSSGVNRFGEFRAGLGLNEVWPAPLQHIISFISHLSLERKAPSTIDTYVNALSFFHKINRWEDPTDNFIVKKLKEGAKRGNKQADSRRPITMDILGKLVNSLSGLCSSSYEVLLFKASFCLAFFGFLRVGEITAVSKKGGVANVLSVEDLKFSMDHSSFEINIRSSKTDQRGVGTTLQFRVGLEPILCPVKAITEFMKVRPTVMGPLFIHFEGSPLTRYQFNAILKKGINSLGLPEGEFSSHSFRIGAATSAALSGIPIEHIMDMGRWRSSAVNSYIRPLKVVVPNSWAL